MQDVSNICVIGLKFAKSKAIFTLKHCIVAVVVCWGRRLSVTVKFIECTFTENKAMLLKLKEKQFLLNGVRMTWRKLSEQMGRLHERIDTNILLWKEMTERTKQQKQFMLVKRINKMVMIFDWKKWTFIRTYPQLPTVASQVPLYLVSRTLSANRPDVKQKSAPRLDHLVVSGLILLTNL